MSRVTTWPPAQLAHVPKELATPLKPASPCTRSHLPREKLIEKDASLNRPWLTTQQVEFRFIMMSKAKANNNLTWESDHHGSFIPVQYVCFPKMRFKWILLLISFYFLYRPFQRSIKIHLSIFYKPSSNYIISRLSTQMRLKILQKFRTNHWI